MLLLLPLPLSVCAHHTIAKAAAAATFAAAAAITTSTTSGIASAVSLLPASSLQLRKLSAYAPTLSAHLASQTKRTQENSPKPTDLHKQLPATQSSYTGRDKALFSTGSMCSLRPAGLPVSLPAPTKQLSCKPLLVSAGLPAHSVVVSKLAGLGGLNTGRGEGFKPSALQARG